MTGPAIARLAALGLFGCILQLTAVAQITIFGVPADLSPLLVCSVGLLMGSVPGALFGFCVGLFVDIALLQTLGISSLVLTAVGYGAGRLRELRDPAHGARPGRGRRDRHRRLRDRLLDHAVPARRRRARLAPARARDPRW